MQISHLADALPVSTMIGANTPCSRAQCVYGPSIVGLEPTNFYQTSSITSKPDHYPHVVPNLYTFLSYVEHKIRYFEEPNSW